MIPDGLWGSTTTNSVKTYGTTVVRPSLLVYGLESTGN